MKKLLLSIALLYLLTASHSQSFDRFNDYAFEPDTVVLRKNNTERLDTQKILQVVSDLIDIADLQAGLYDLRRMKEYKCLQMKSYRKYKKCMCSKLLQK